MKILIVIAAFASILAIGARNPKNYIDVFWLKYFYPHPWFESSKEGNILIGDIYTFHLNNQRSATAEFLSSSTFQNFSLGVV